MVDNFIIKPLEWDSKFFDKPIGQLEFKENSTNLCEFDEFSLIQAKINSKNYLHINTLNKLNFKFVEGEIDFIIDLNDIEADDNNLSILVAQNSDINAIKLIADNAYQLSRYRSPWFTKQQNSNLYQLWVKKSILGTFDDVCLIIKSNGVIQGFITLKFKNCSARIGLICVNEKFQGQGIGSMLLKHSIYFCKNKYIEKLHVATQTSNLSAIGLYTKLDFSINSLSFWFYKT